MCDPLSLGIVSAVGAVASQAGSYFVQRNAMKRAEDAQATWRAGQARYRAEENARQDELRKQAEGARRETVTDLLPANQQKAQRDEQARLTAELSADSFNPSVADETLLSGGSLGGETFKSDAAGRLAKASADARKRIAALATMGSYGNSFGGVGTRAQEVLARGDQGISLANNMRQGSLSAYGIEKAIQPLQTGTTVDPFGGIASALGGIAGKSFGSYMGRA